MEKERRKQIPDRAPGQPGIHPGGNANQRLCAPQVVLVVGAGIEVAIGQRVTKGHGVIEGQDTDGNERAAAKEKQMRARRTLRSRRPALRPQQVEEEGRQNAGEQHVGLAHDCGPARGEAGRQQQPRLVRVVLFTGSVPQQQRAGDERPHTAGKGVHAAVV